MTAGRRRRTLAGGLVAALVLLAGCGADTDYAPVRPIEGAPPADLCSTVPEALREGLTTTTSTPTAGEVTTAACALRSPVGSARSTAIVVTWLRLDDTESARSVLESQCRSIDSTAYTVTDELSLEGADEACSGRSKTATKGSSDSATLAAISDRSLVTARVTVTPPAGLSADDRASRIATGIFSSLDSPDGS